MSFGLSGSWGGGAGRRRPTVRSIQSHRRFSMAVARRASSYDGPARSARQSEHDRSRDAGVFHSSKRRRQPIEHHFEVWTWRVGYIAADHQIAIAVYPVKLLLQVIDELAPVGAELRAQVHQLEAGRR